MNKKGKHMGIEAIRRGGISMATRFGGVSAIRGGSTIGSIGARFEGGLSRGVSVISNPFKTGPVRSSLYVENRVSLFSRPRVETIKNPFRAERPLVSRLKAEVDFLSYRRAKRSFSKEAVIAGAEDIVRRVQQPGWEIPKVRPVFVVGPNHGEIKPVQHALSRIVQIEQFNPEINAFPKITRNAPTTAVEVKPAVEKRTQMQIQQVVDEIKVVKEQKKEKKPLAKKSEKATSLKVRLVEAVEISRKRRLEIKEAVRRAKTEAEKTGVKGITGRLVVKLLSLTFWEHKSPIVREGKDGTLQPTIYEIQKDEREYQNETEAEASLVQYVDKHIPVKRGEDGRLATTQEVKEVLEGKEKEALTVKTAAEIVVNRMVRKSLELTKGGQAVTLVEEKKEETGETSLKDYPDLAEVFQKAA